jgi:tRNA (guanine37-N1)-methyltransferase
MHIEVLSLFPSYIEGPIHESILKRAIQKNLMRVSNVDIRSFSTRKDSRVDDRSFGGGPGMVMMAEPVAAAIRSCRTPSSRVVYVSPQGERLTPHLAKELSKISHLIIVCGHYEGIDQRVIDSDVDQEISIGDYVLTNGCLAALVLIDVVARYIPGVLGHEDAATEDSFEKGIFDHQHYTQPRVFEGKEVPEALLSGDHEKIARWRSAQALTHTKERRPDLVAREYLAASSARTDGVSMQQLVEPCFHFDEVIRFYENVFGVVPDADTQNARFLCEGFVLTFLRVEGLLPSISSMFSVSVPLQQFQKAVTWCRRKKGQLVSEPILEGDMYVAVVKDPDGRLVQMTSIGIMRGETNARSSHLS